MGTWETKPGDLGDETPPQSGDLGDETPLQVLKTHGKGGDPGT